MSGEKENQIGKKQALFFGDDVYYSDNQPNGENVMSENQTEKKSQNQQVLSDELESLPSIPHSKVYRPKRSFLVNIFEWLDVVVASIVVVVILFSFVFRIVAIDGSSMNNTLIDGERVIISNMFYEPTHGDIVVISRNTENSSKKGTYDEPIIKRIIATEGDTVNIDFEKGVVYVNNQALKEDYIKEPTYRFSDVSFPIVVKENCVFVLGDNRNDSLDSRSSEIGEGGLIDEKYILGHAIIRVYPFNKFGGIQ